MATVPLPPDQQYWVSRPLADDPRIVQVHRDVPPRDVPYVPTEPAIVEAMLDMAAVGSGDVVYDLGCGDGRICIAAAQRGARAVGVDIDPLRIRESRHNARLAGVVDRVEFRCESFFDVDLSPATVVTLFLLTRINIQLRPKLQRELRAGTRVVANTFGLGDWAWDARKMVQHRWVYLWLIPARVEGRWRCWLEMAPSRQRMLLDLHRRNQFVTGTAKTGGREIPIINGRLAGDELTFTLPHMGGAMAPTRFECRFDGQYLRGTCHLKGAGDRPVRWAGLRG